jgi:hypothetical protein
MDLHTGVCGMGKVKIEGYWVDAYYQHHPATAGENDPWVVRVRQGDYEALEGQWAERVRLRLPHEAPRDVRPVSQRFQGSFVWLEFEWAPPAVEVTVDSSEVMSARQ